MSLSLLIDIHQFFHERAEAHVSLKIRENVHNITGPRITANRLHQINQHTYILIASANIHIYFKIQLYSIVIQWFIRSFIK